MSDSVRRTRTSALRASSSSSTISVRSLVRDAVARSMIPVRHLQREHGARLLLVLVRRKAPTHTSGMAHVQRSGSQGTSPRAAVPAPRREVGVLLALTLPWLLPG